MANENGSLRSKKPKFWSRPPRSIWLSPTSRTALPITPGTTSGARAVFFLRSSSPPTVPMRLGVARLAKV